MSDQNEKFVARVKDFLSGFSVIKSFKAEGEANRLFQASNAETERVKERRRLWDAMLASITAVMRQLFFRSASSSTALGWPSGERSRWARCSLS